MGKNIIATLWDQLTIFGKFLLVVFISLLISSGWLFGSFVYSQIFPQPRQIMHQNLNNTNSETGVFYQFITPKTLNNILYHEANSVEVKFNATLLNPGTVSQIFVYEGIPFITTKTKHYYGEDLTNQNLIKYELFGRFIQDTNISFYLNKTIRQDYDKNDIILSDWKNDTNFLTKINLTFFKTDKIEKFNFSQGLDLWRSEKTVFGKNFSIVIQKPIYDNITFSKNQTFFVSVFSNRDQIIPYKVKSY